MIAALRHERNSIGVEIDPDYCKMAARYLKAEASELFGDAELLFERATLQKAQCVVKEEPAPRPLRRQTRPAKDRLTVLRMENVGLKITRYENQMLKGEFHFKVHHGEPDDTPRPSVDVHKDTLNFFFEAGNKEYSDECGNRTTFIMGKLQAYQRIALTQGMSTLRIICEPTGEYHKKLFWTARKMGFDTCYVNAV